jgi:hypothetical protein
MLNLKGIFMQLNTIPIHYKEWFKSTDADHFRWLFPTEASISHFLRTRKNILIEANLIDVIPTRGYFIRVDKFTEEAIKPFFILGRYANTENGANVSGEMP